jgi:hypothetical protein
VAHVELHWPPAHAYGEQLVLEDARQVPVPLHREPTELSPLQAEVPHETVLGAY